LQTESGLIHGGNLNALAGAYGIAPQNWIDLSTGISPVSYPVPDIPPGVWRQLPQEDPELLKIAGNYYGADELMVTSGSQAMIQTLPGYRLQLGFQKARVWLPLQGYKEHEKAWCQQGFLVQHYSQLPEVSQLIPQDVVVVINPNNPTGECYSPQQLCDLLTVLAQLQGWLIVDEAFMDSEPEGFSMAEYSNQPECFVLKSVGKFFGLAGIRLGFLLANPQHLQGLKRLQGPWQVNGAALYIAKHALADKAWQASHLQQLQALSAELESFLSRHFHPHLTRPVAGRLLFKTCYIRNATAWYHALCQKAVYVRLTDEGDALRFGLPLASQLKVLNDTLSSIEFI